MALALERIRWSNAAFWVRRPAQYDLAQERTRQEAFWAADAIRQAGYVEPAGDQLDAQVGYGLPIGAWLVGTPQLRVTTSMPRTGLGVAAGVPHTRPRRSVSATPARRR